MTFATVADPVLPAIDDRAFVRMGACVRRVTQIGAAAKVDVAEVVLGDSPPLAGALGVPACLVSYRPY